MDELIQKLLLEIELRVSDTNASAQLKTVVSDLQKQGSDLKTILEAVNKTAAGMGASVAAGAQAATTQINAVQTAASKVVSTLSTIKTALQQGGVALPAQGSQGATPAQGINAIAAAVTNMAGAIKTANPELDKLNDFLTRLQNNLAQKGFAQGDISGIAKLLGEYGGGEIKSGRSLSEISGELLRLQKSSLGIGNERVKSASGDEIKNTLSQMGINLDAIETAKKAYADLDKFLDGLRKKVIAGGISENKTDSLISEMKKNVDPVIKAGANFSQIMAGVFSPAAGVFNAQTGEVKEFGRALTASLNEAGVAVEKLASPQTIQRISQIFKEMALGKNVSKEFKQVLQGIGEELSKEHKTATLTKAFNELQNTGSLTQKTAIELSQAFGNMEGPVKGLAGSFAELFKELKFIEGRQTYYAFRELFSAIQTHIPVLALAINPTATLVRGLADLVRTGGPVGALFRTLTGLAHSFASSLVRVAESAAGFVIANTILAPFRILENLIQRVASGFQNFVSHAITLNQQVGKTSEQITEMNQVYDKFILTLTKPVYDFVIGKLQGLFSGFQKASGSTADFTTALYSLGAALGSELQKLLSNLYDWGAKIFGGAGPFDPAKWLRAGAELAANFASGLIEGFVFTVVPAITSIAQGIANFIIGHSPPPLGPLRDIINGGKNLITDWMRGFLLADFGYINTLASLIKSKLDAAVSSGSIKQSSVASIVSSAQEVIASAVAEITLLGSVSQGVLGSLHSIFGELYGDVLNYLHAIEEVRAATVAVAAAQAVVEEIQERIQAQRDIITAATEYEKSVQEKVTSELQKQDDVIRAIQDEITRFQLNTSEIPERFTRGRLRQLQLELLNEQEKRNAMQKTADAQIKAAQKQIEAAQKIEASLQKQEQAAQKNLQAEQKKLAIAQENLRLQEALIQAIEKQYAAQAQAKVNLTFPAVDENLKKRIQKFIEDNVITPMQQRLANATSELQDFLRAFLTGKADKLKGKDEGVSPAAQVGLDLRKAIESLGKAFDVFKQRDFPAMLSLLQTDLHLIGASLDIIAQAVKSVSDAWNGLPPDVRKFITDGTLKLFENLPKLLKPNFGLNESLGDMLTNFISPKQVEDFLNWLVKIANGFIDFINGAVKWGEDIGKNLGLIYRAFFQFWDDLFGHSVIPDIVAGFDGFIKYLKDLPTKISEAVSGLGDAISKAAKDVWENLPDWIKNPVEWLKKQASQLFSGDKSDAGKNDAGIGDSTKKLNEAIAAEPTSITEAMKGWYNAFDESLRKIGTLLTDWLENEFNVVIPEWLNNIQLSFGVFGQNLWIYFINGWVQAVINTPFENYLIAVLSTNMTAWFKYIEAIYYNFGFEIWDKILEGFIAASTIAPLSNYITAATASAPGGQQPAEVSSIPQLALGGLITKSGLAHVDAGEMVGNPSKFGGNMTIVNNWPEGIDSMSRPDFEKMAEEAAYRAIKRVFKK